MPDHFPGQACAACRGRHAAFRFSWKRARRKWSRHSHCDERRSVRRSRTGILPPGRRDQHGNTREKAYGRSSESSKFGEGRANIPAAQGSPARIGTRFCVRDGRSTGATANRRAGEKARAKNEPKNHFHRSSRSHRHRGAGKFGAVANGIAVLFAAPIDLRPRATTGGVRVRANPPFDGGKRGLYRRDSRAGVRRNAAAAPRNR